MKRLEVMMKRLEEMAVFLGGNRQGISKVNRGSVKKEFVRI